MKKETICIKSVNIPNFNALTANDKFTSLMKSEQNKVGKFSWNCYQIRRSKLFS